MTNLTASLFVASFLLVGLVATVSLGVATVEHDGEMAAAANETRPGEQLSGVVGVQGAELDGELESRAFGLAVAEAETDEARADVVAAQLERNERRFEDLDDRRAELRDQRDAGELDEGAYRARIAVTVARVEAVRQTNGQAAAAAQELPEDRREERGIDAASIAALHDRADELVGPEVADIARGVAGDSVGAPVGVPDERPDRGESERGRYDQARSDGQSAGNGSGAGATVTQTPTPDA